MNKRCYLVKLDGKIGFYLAVTRRTPESIKKMTSSQYPRAAVNVEFLPDSTEEEVARMNATIINGTHEGKMY